MSNNVYIGNRYVPLFANPVEWDNLREYEALTIVTYNGTSYTSKKRVPVGTALSDTDYWVVTGNYNAQVEEYRKKTNAVEKIVNRLDNKNIRIIGDSYGTTNGSGELVIDPYPRQLQALLGYDDEHYKTAHQNGAGFGNGAFITLLNSFENDDTVTDLYVFGGWNDVVTRYSIETVQANMRTFATIAREKFPNAKLHLGMLAYSYSISQEDMTNLDILNFYTYRQCVRHGFDCYENTAGVCVYQLADFWVNTTTAQGVSHPSSTGSTYIAIALCNLINCGNVNVNYVISSDELQPSENVLTTTFGVINVLNNGTNITKWFANNEIIFTANPESGVYVPSVFGEPQLNIGHYGNIGCQGYDTVSTFVGAIRMHTVTQQDAWVESMVKVHYVNKQLFIGLMGAGVHGVTEAYIKVYGECTSTPYRS